MSATAPTHRQQLFTIGNVCRRLKAEFPDISISKIRYLEDQGLLSLKRTQGGYRLFGEDDVERLETILRLQRDEFLPLRVIREELAAGAGRERRRRRAGLGEAEPDVDLEELCRRSGLDPARARELEEFGLLEPRVHRGRRVYTETDVEIAALCDTLARYGIAARHLRAFRTAADRESGLLEALVAPSLRSRSADRRRAGLEDLQRLAETAQELSQLLFTRNVRRLAE
jgi:DNA-binding transcriptional MerR regulator